MDLGVEVPATNESIESLFYGTLLNLFTELDHAEIEQISLFPDKANNTEAFYALASELIGNQQPEFVVWSKEEMAGLIIDEAVSIIGSHFSGDGFSYIGIMDNVFM